MQIYVFCCSYCRHRRHRLHFFVRSSDTCSRDTRAIVFFHFRSFVVHQSLLPLEGKRDCTAPSCNSHNSFSAYPQRMYVSLSMGGDRCCLKKTFRYLGSHFNISKCNYTVRQTVGHEYSRDGTRGENHIVANEAETWERTNVLVNRTVDKDKRQEVVDAKNQRHISETITKNMWGSMSRRPLPQCCVSCVRAALAD